MIIVRGKNPDRTLGRWYNIDVFYSRDELRSYQFSLNMKKHEEFTQVLELIGKTGEVQFEIKDNTVIVKIKK